MTQKLTILRLQKEQASIERQPIPNAIVTREGHLNFHFCLYNLQGAYKGGLYHGLFQLHQNYPFNAPKLYFYTPSGRFQINLPICTSFTNYHQQTWTSAWNVRSLILATISFMYSEEPSYGCRSDTEYARQEYAKNSKKYNFTHIPNFAKFFGQKLVDIKQITQQQLVSYSKSEQSQQNKQVPSVDQPGINQEHQVQQLQVKYYNQNENQNKLQIPLLVDLQQEIKPNKNENRPPNNLKKVIFKGLVAVTVFGVVVYVIARFK